MKKMIALLLAAVLCLSLAACGGNAEEPAPEPTAPVITLSAEQQLIVDAVQTHIGSEEFVNRQNLYKEFTGNEPKNAEIAKVVHVSIGDFEGVAVDGYLVSIAADVAWWHDEAAQQGISENHFNIFIDSNSKAVYDSITTDAANGPTDTTTDEGRAIYLLWIFGNVVGGYYEGNDVSDTETAVEMTADEISLINAELNK